jgi:hypothetical protein
MRFVFAFLLFLAANLGAVRAADVEFARVWPGYRDAESFERISEFFTGKENTGRITVLRTQAATRDGFYFFVRLHNRGAALADAKFSLQVITPNNPQPKTFVFPAAVGGGTNLFNLGLTGADWSQPKQAHPVAWRLDLLAGDGSTVATAQSFLWEKPAK